LPDKTNWRTVRTIKIEDVDLVRFRGVLKHQEHTGIYREGCRKTRAFPYYNILQSDQCQSGKAPIHSGKAYGHQVLLFENGGVNGAARGLVVDLTIVGGNLEF
jgi:hypothetical protein